MVKCFYLGLMWALAAAAAGEAPARKVTVVHPDSRTGRLVRSVVVSSRVVHGKPVAAVEPNAKPERAAATPPETLREAVEQAAWRNAVPTQMLHSVIKVESNYNPLAVSPKGAMGLMQLIPSTARRFGVSDVFNPVENLNGGARYLRYLMDLYGEDQPHLVLAAYNAGEGAVARYGGVPPYPETRNYLTLIAQDLKKAHQRAAGSDAPAASHETVEVKPVEVQNHIYKEIEPDGRIRYVSR